MGSSKGWWKNVLQKNKTKQKNYAWISKWFPPNKLLFYLHFPTNLLKNTCTQFLPFFSYGFSEWAIRTVTCFHSNQTLTVSHMVILWLFLTCLAQTTHPGAILDNCGWNPVLFLPSPKNPYTTRYQVSHRTFLTYLSRDQSYIFTQGRTHRAGEWYPLPKCDYAKTFFLIWGAEQLTPAIGLVVQGGMSFVGRLMACLPVCFPGESFLQLLPV